MLENNSERERIESQANDAMKPHSSDEVFDVLERLARLSEQKYIFTSYPATNTQNAGLA